MFDYQKHFDEYCKENSVESRLSFDMPPGYETAYGTFDFETKTVFINKDYLSDAPDHEKAFFLFHELRHASQYLHPERFSGAIGRSLDYVIMYDGTCYKLKNGGYVQCRLEGTQEYFTDLYLGQPNEADANAFAYETVKSIFGDSDALIELYGFFAPRKTVPDELYDSVYIKIDEKTD